MGHILRDHIKQAAPFENASQEAMLNLFVAAAEVRRRVERVCERHDLQFSHHNVLRILRGAHPEGHPRCEIIERMLDPSPDVTRLIDKLVERGLVRRSTSDEDRRVTLHTVTDDGLALLEQMDPEIREVQQWFGARVADRDLQHLSRICEGIYAGFQDEG
ncbi:MarR family winged helix-turn-helix transcriptional regulator [Salinibacter grassmerensis]|uniref:MarR family winged helix-turn-helix transcriptional regulator n=1 Tax=Salinibacter grassmerensis TaxID=3040353 RepID=UPI0021E842AA|nr:MarR family transcriptional regulator [Salinibacter grassmerensis]